LFARKVNVTDPDSRIVSDRGKLIQGYNVQAAVADGQVILAAAAGQSANDQAELAAMVAAARAKRRASGIEDEIEQVLADSGYWNRDQIVELNQAGIDVLVPPRRNPPNPSQVMRDMVQRLTAPEGATAYRRRQQIVEPVFAHIKHLRGITRVLRRPSGRSGRDRPHRDQPQPPQALPRRPPSALTGHAATRGTPTAPRRDHDRLLPEPSSRRPRAPARLILTTQPPCDANS
jgi:hypothetical protein